MPTIFLLKNVRIVVFPKDHPPPHVHVIGPGASAKIRLGDFECVSSRGFSRRDIRRLIAFMRTVQEDLWQAWSEYHEE